MSSNRWYFAPVDPGYGQFGASIAAGMGQAADAFTQAQLRRQEEERYRERLAREDAQIAQARADRQAEIEARNQQEGRLTVADGMGTVTMGPGGLPMVLPRPGWAPPQATGAAPTAPEPAGVTAPAPQQLAPPVSGATTTAAPASTPSAPPPAARDPISAARDFMGVPEGAYVDPRISRMVQFDPSKSEAAQTGAYQQQLAREREEQDAATLRSEIAEALKDGVTVAEGAYLKKKYGLTMEDLEHPDKAYEKGWKRRQAEIRFAHELEMEQIAARESQQNNEITRNRQLSVNNDNAIGDAMRLSNAGQSADQIFEALRVKYAGDVNSGGVGGEGALHKIIQGALSQRDVVNVARAGPLVKDILASRPAAEGGPIFPAMEGYAEAYAAKERELLERWNREARERARVFEQQQKREDTGRRGVDIGGGNAISAARAPVPAAAPPEVAPTPAAAPLVPTRADIETRSAMFKGKSAADIRQYLLDRGASRSDADWAAKKYGNKGTAPRLGRI